MNNIEKIINKKNIKEANGMNTDAEQAAILTEFVNMCNDIDVDMEYSDELQKCIDKYPVMSPLPIIICKEHLPLYFELYNDMKNKFISASNNQTLTQEFIRSFELFEEFFVCHYGENLLKVGNWEKEEPLQDVSIDNILAVACDDAFVSLQRLLSLLEKANAHLPRILNDCNKGQCMYFYPVVHSTLTEMAEIVNKNPCI